MDVAEPTPDAKPAAECHALACVGMLGGVGMLAWTNCCVFWPRISNSNPAVHG